MEHDLAACDAPTIQESDLQNAVVKAIHEVLGEKDAVLPILEMNIVEVLSNDSSSEVSEIDRRLGELQQELLRLANSKNDYTDLADEIYRLREERQAILVQDAECDGKRQRIEKMKAFLEEQADLPAEYNEQLVRRLIEKVTVFDEKITVRFKSGVEIDVENEMDTETPAGLNEICKVFVVRYLVLVGFGMYNKFCIYRGNHGNIR